MVPKQPTNQPTDRQTGGTQPTDEQTSAGFGKQQKTQEKVSFQAFTMRKQSCSPPCHCKAVRNTLANTQVSQTSKTRPHARNNWGTWRGHNNQLQGTRAGCVPHPAKTHVDRRGLLDTRLKTRPVPDCFCLEQIMLSRSKWSTDPLNRPLRRL